MSFPHHTFKPYADMPEYCVAEMLDTGDTCNRPRDDHYLPPSVDERRKQLKRQARRTR